MVSASSAGAILRHRLRQAVDHVRATVTSGLPSVCALSQTVVADRTASLYMRLKVAMSARSLFDALFDGRRGRRGCEAAPETRLRSPSRAPFERRDRFDEGAESRPASRRDRW